MATPSLLIVCPAEFSDPAQRLMGHKRASGMAANAYSLPDLITNVSGRDDAEKLKLAIYNASRDQRAVRYVLLLGDGRHLPVRYRRTPQIPGFNGNPYADWYTAADLYYSNLYLRHAADGEGATADTASGFSTWDADRDGFYDSHHWNNSDIVEWNPDQVDGCPDVAVGRVPAHTLDDANAYVDKVIAYENGPGAPVFIPFIAEKEYDTSAQMIESVIQGSGVAAAGFGVQRIGYGYLPGDTLPAGFSATPIEQAARGATFLVYLGHGGVNSWGHRDDLTYDNLTSAQVASFTSGTQPVVLSIGCSTGAWVPGAPDDYAQGYRDINNVEHDVHYAQNGTVFTVTDTNPASNGLSTTWTISDNHDKVPVVPPNEYDLDRPSPSLAVGWLFNREGGGVAFCGETAIGPDNFGADFVTGLLSAWKGSGTVLGDMWLSAGQRYWARYKDSEDSIGAARLYLTYMTLLGDPSLRVKLRPTGLPPAPAPHTVWRATWTPGWTSVVPVSVAGKPYLISYKAASGRAAIDHVNPDLSGTTPHWGGTLPSGYTTLTPFFIGAVAHVLGYDVDTGAIGIYRVDLGNDPGLTRLWTAQWTTGWTTIAPVTLAGQPHLFEYKAASGTVAIDRVEPTGCGNDRDLAGHLDDRMVVHPAHRPRRPRRPVRVQGRGRNRGDRPGRRGRSGDH